MAKTAEKEKDPMPEYPFIRVWGAQLGSQQYYIDDEIERARNTGAPQNAVYPLRGGSPDQWVTTDDMDPTQKDKLEGAVKARYG